METLSVSEARTTLKTLVDRVDGTHERVTLTRNGRPAAVLISPDDLESLEETLSVLSDPALMRQLDEAKAAVAAGDVLDHEGVAAAVIEFITGDLVHTPRRVGKPLHNELAGQWSARRGTYRVLYTVDDEHQAVTVLVIEHRSDVYRPR